MTTSGLGEFVFVIISKIESIYFVFSVAKYWNIVLSLFFQSTVACDGCRIHKLTENNGTY